MDFVNFQVGINDGHMDHMVCNELNARILVKMGHPKRFTLEESDFETKGEVGPDEIFTQVNLLQSFEDKLGGKKLNMGGLGELIISSEIGLHLLAGQTMRGPDAVNLDESNGLRRGRYQIKYRNWDTSDIAFRVDVEKSGRILERYEWDYLLIATHGDDIIPDQFFVVPLVKAVELSEVLTSSDPTKQAEPNRSGRNQNCYYSFRLNWSWDRKGLGCTGRKRDLIAGKYGLKRNGVRHSVKILDTIR